MDSPAEPIPGLEKFMADGDYFLIVSRLLPYKNIEHAVEAFTRMGKKLLIIGRGPEKDSLLKTCRADGAYRLRSASSATQLR